MIGRLQEAFWRLAGLRAPRPLKTGRLMRKRTEALLKEARPLEGMTSRHRG